MRVNDWPQNADPRIEAVTCLSSNDSSAYDTGALPESQSPVTLERLELSPLVKTEVRNTRNYPKADLAAN